MMIEDVEAQLGAALRDLVPEPRPRAGLAELVETTARRHRRNRRTGVAAALGVLLVAGGLSVNGLANRPVSGGQTAASVQDQDGPLTPAPPAVDAKRPHLVISPSTLPRSGGLLTVTTVNPTARSVTHSYVGILDRWNGSAWTPYRQVLISYTTTPSKPSKMYPVNQELTILAIGITAPAHGSGMARHLRLPTLPSGFYRLTQEFSQGHSDSTGKGNYVSGWLRGIFEIHR
jgi:hypothetical protein